MAGYLDRINVVIDVASNKAVGALKDFRKNVSEAEGFTGKFKAGAGSLKDTLTGMVPGPLAAAGAITAVGVAAFKAADEFVKLARESAKLSGATGLTVEDSSRLLEVFGDLGGDGAALAGTIGKIAKDLDADKWAEYGIATREATGEARDANEIFLESLDALRKIKNPTERAAAGVDLFGKSWANLAPLIALSDEELRKALDTVSDAKTITAEEVKQAEDLAAARDSIADSWDDMTLALGQAVAALAPVIESVGYLLGIVSDMVGYVTGLVADAADELAGWWEGLWEPSEAEKAAQRIKDIAAEVPPVLISVGDAAKEAAQMQAEAAEDAEALALALAGEQWSLKHAAYEAESQLKSLRDEIGNRKAWADFQLSVMAIWEDIAAINKEIAKGGDDVDTWKRKLESAMAGGEQDVLDFLAQLGKLDPTIVQDVLLDFTNGDADTFFKRVQELVDKRDIKIQTNLITPSGRISGAAEAGQTPAAGGITTADALAGPGGGSIGNTYVTVQGALDPVGVGRQIITIINQDRARRGLPPI